jgi:feruloyl-CoA synthase
LGSDNPDVARDDTLLLAEPASVDGGEITDKGCNQRAVLTRRADAVAILEDDAATEWISCAG